MRSAHAAGLRVMVKPHLEMRGFEATDEERRILQGPDSPGPPRSRRPLRGAAGDGRAPAAQPDRDAQRGATGGAGSRATRPTSCPTRATRRRRAPTCSASAGRWTRRSSRARPTGAPSSRGSGPSSAGRSPTRPTSTPGRGSGSGTRSTSSASRPTSRCPTGPTRRSPSSRPGWERALEPLAAASRRWGRPVLLTEAGFPSIPSAASAPWREERVAGRRVAAGPLLRGDAARPRAPPLRSRGPSSGSGSARRTPPFRDPSHAIVGKPATFTMARWYCRSGDEVADGRRERRRRHNSRPTPPTGSGAGDEAEPAAHLGLDHVGPGVPSTTTISSFSRRRSRIGWVFSR